MPPQRPLLAVSNWEKDGAGIAHLAEAFVIARTRTFADDPRFGLIVLAEIASRALSPAVNDPGTAIDIINMSASTSSAFIRGRRTPARTPRRAMPKYC